MDKRTVGVDHSILLKKRGMFKFDCPRIYLLISKKCHHQFLEELYLGSVWL